jgi:hypothetical protein
MSGRRASGLGAGGASRAPGLASMPASPLRPGARATDCPLWSMRSKARGPDIEEQAWQDGLPPRSPARAEEDPCPVRAEPRDVGRPEGAAPGASPAGTLAEEIGPRGVAPSYADASGRPAPHAGGGLASPAAQHEDNG